MRSRIFDRIVDDDVFLVISTLSHYCSQEASGLVGTTTQDRSSCPKRGVAQKRDVLNFPIGSAGLTMESGQPEADESENVVTVSE